MAVWRRYAGEPRCRGPALRWPGITGRSLFTVIVLNTLILGECRDQAPPVSDGAMRTGSSEKVLRETGTVCTLFCCHMQHLRIVPVPHKIFGFSEFKCAAFGEDLYTAPIVTPPVKWTYNVHASSSSYRTYRLCALLHSPRRFQ